MGNDFAFINWILNLLIHLNPIVPDSSKLATAIDFQIRNFDSSCYGPQLSLRRLDYFAGEAKLHKSRLLKFCQSHVTPLSGSKM